MLTLSTLHSPHAQNTNPTTTRLGSECLSNLPQHMSGSCMALCQHLPQRPHSAPHLRPGSACRNIAGHCCCPGEGSHASGNTCGYTRGWRSVLDETCTHSSSLAACETLFTSGAEFGEMTSPAQSGRLNGAAHGGKQLTCIMLRARNSPQNSWTAAVPLGVTPRGRTHLVDLIWLAEPSLDERTHLAGTGSRRLGKPRVRTSMATR